LEKEEKKDLDPYQEYDTLYKKYDETVKEKEDAARELQRLRDSQKLRADALEASGVASKAAGKPVAKAPSGY
jgi:hypothetical protein